MTNQTNAPRTTPQAPAFYVGDPAQPVAPGTEAYEYIARNLVNRDIVLEEIESAHLHASGIVTYTAKAHDDDEAYPNPHAGDDELYARAQNPHDDGFEDPATDWDELTADEKAAIYKDIYPESHIGITSPRSDRRKTPATVIYRTLTYAELRDRPYRAAYLDTAGRIADVKITSVKTWKTRPEIEIHLQYGLYEYWTDTVYPTTPANEIKIVEILETIPPARKSARQ